jgi:D-beta-D-heptose 7-phosphate kinase/D-beta-D-heptose 1-phosphate adenosyltransferase
MAGGTDNNNLAFDLDEVCLKISESYAPEILVITLGAEGMAICKEGKVEKILPTQAKEVFDVSGAGDTVIATLTASLIAGASVETAAKLANKAAGCVVAHSGTVPVVLDELIASI